MKYSDYRKWTDRATDWIEGYFSTLRDKPVRSQVAPGEIRSRFPATPPDTATPMDVIMDDFERLIPDGITHWQHPRFFAYFPANAAPASMIAEQLTNAIASQCMLWQTSPAATELEQVVVGWLRDGLGLAPHFTGVIQDTASGCTLSAVLTMRELALAHSGNIKGLSGQQCVRIYASDQTHSSVDKAIWIAGIGQENLVKVPMDDDFAMRPEALRAAILADIKNGLKPAGIVACIGGTGIGASDRLDPIMDIAKEFGLYTHVDAAWAGSAMICPEFRHIWAGVDRADSIVFNPHKWLGAQFDCSVQFLADPQHQVRTLGIQPDYLKTLGTSDVVNFSEWGLPLGRRFRALKIWFLIRAYGLDGLRERLRNHIAWTRELEAKLANHPNFTIITESRFALFSFQYTPQDLDPNEETSKLIQRINDDGRIYLTQTNHQGKFVIRFTAGQFDCTRDDVMAAFDVLTEMTRQA